MKQIVIAFVLAMSLFSNEIIIKQSSCNVNTTIKNIKNIAKKKKLSIFTIIDHKKNAELAGMHLNESKMIIFGNPHVGTTLMLEDMTVGLDLPIRILVYRDTCGKVKMAYRNGAWLDKMHILSSSKEINMINTMMDKITTKAGTCTID